MVSEYRLRRRVQFYETDAAGIVHFSWFFRYMEEAEHALWREAGLSIAPIVADVGWPRVAASFDFHRPLRFEDEFDVLIRVAAISEKTMRYVCLIIACVSKGNEPLRAVSIPADIASRFQAVPEGSERP